MSSPTLGIGTTVNTSALTGFTIASIDFSGSGDNTLVAGIANKTIRVFRLFIVVASATSLIFKDGSTALNGALPMSANGGLTFDLSNEPWFYTSAGSNFILNSSNAGQIGGRIWYQQS